MADIMLQVTPEQLEEKAGEVSGLIHDVEKAFGGIRDSVSATERYWKGDASVKHQKLFLEKEEQITEVLARLKEHPDDLLKMAGIYKRVEQETIALAQTLQADIIT